MSLINDTKESRDPKNTSPVPPIPTVNNLAASEPDVPSESASDESSLPQLLPEPTDALGALQSTSATGIPDAVSFPEPAPTPEPEAPPPPTALEEFAANFNSQPRKFSATDINTQISTDLLVDDNATMGEIVQGAAEKFDLSREAIEFRNNPFLYDHEVQGLAPTPGIFTSPFDPNWAQNQGIVVQPTVDINQLYKDKGRGFEPDLRDPTGNATQSMEMRGQPSERRWSLGEQIRGAWGLAGTIGESLGQKLWGSIFGEKKPGEFDDRAWYERDLVSNIGGLFSGGPTEEDRQFERDTGFSYTNRTTLDMLGDQDKAGVYGSGSAGLILRGLDFIGNTTRGLMNDAFQAAAGVDFTFDSVTDAVGARDTFSYMEKGSIQGNPLDNLPDIARVPLGFVLDALTEVPGEALLGAAGRAGRRVAVETAEEAVEGAIRSTTNPNTAIQNPNTTIQGPEVSGPIPFSENPNTVVQGPQVSGPNTTIQSPFTAIQPDPGVSTTIQNPFTSIQPDHGVTTTIQEAVTTLQEATLPGLDLPLSIQLAEPGLIRTRPSTNVVPSSAGALATTGTSALDLPPINLGTAVLEPRATLTLPYSASSPRMLPSEALSRSRQTGVIDLESVEVLPPKPILSIPQLTGEQVAGLLPDTLTSNVNRANDIIRQQYDVAIEGAHSRTLQQEINALLRQQALDRQALIRDMNTVPEDLGVGIPGEGTVYDDAVENIDSYDFQFSPDEFSLEDLELDDSILPSEALPGTEAFAREQALLDKYSQVPDIADDALDGLGIEAPTKKVGTMSERTRTSPSTLSDAEISQMILDGRIDELEELGDAPTRRNAPVENQQWERIPEPPDLTPAGRELYSAIDNLGGTQPGTGVPIADLREALPNVPREQLDELLEQWELSGDVALLPYDDPLRIQPRDAEAAIQIGDMGERGRRHIVYLRKREGAARSEPTVEPTPTAQTAPAKQERTWQEIEPDWNYWRNLDTSRTSDPYAIEAFRSRAIETLENGGVPTNSVLRDDLLGYRGAMPEIDAFLDKYLGVGSQAYDGGGIDLSALGSGSSRTPAPAAAPRRESRFEVDIEDDERALLGKSHARQALQDYESDPQRFSLLRHDNAQGEPVGYLSYYENSNVITINNLGSDQTVRGTGTALVDKVKALARVSGRRIEVNATTGAEEFYKKLGFRYEGRDDFMTWRPSFKDKVMGNLQRLQDNQDEFSVLSSMSDAAAVAMGNVSKEALDALDEALGMMDEVLFAGTKAELPDGSVRSLAEAGTTSGDLGTGLEFKAPSRAVEAPSSEAIEVRATEVLESTPLREAVDESMALPRESTIFGDLEVDDTGKIYAAEMFKKPLNGEALTDDAMKVLRDEGYKMFGKFLSARAEYFKVVNKGDLVNSYRKFDELVRKHSLGTEADLQGMRQRVETEFRKQGYDAVTHGNRAIFLKDAELVKVAETPFDGTKKQLARRHNTNSKAGRKGEAAKDAIELNQHLRAEAQEAKEATDRLIRNKVDDLAEKKRLARIEARKKKAAELEAQEAAMADEAARLASQGVDGLDDSQFCL